MFQRFFPSYTAEIEKSGEKGNYELIFCMPYRSTVGQNQEGKLILRMTSVPPAEELLKLFGGVYLGTKCVSFSLRQRAAEPSEEGCDKMDSVAKSDGKMYAE